MLFEEGLLDLRWCGLQRLASLGAPRSDEVQESHDCLSLLVIPLARPLSHQFLSSRIMSVDGIFLVYQAARGERLRRRTEGRGADCPVIMVRSHDRYSAVVG